MSNVDRIVELMVGIDVRSELDAIKGMARAIGFGCVAGDDQVKRAELILLLTPQREAAVASGDVFDFIWNRPDQTAAEFLEDHGVKSKDD